MNTEEIYRQRCAEFPTLTFAMCYEVHKMSASLSLEECYDILLLEPSDLTPAENKFFEKVYKRGKACHISIACDHLFSNMKTARGGPVAMDYLTRQSGQFSVEAQKTNSGGLSFRVVIPEID